MSYITPYLPSAWDIYHDLQRPEKSEYGKLAHAQLDRYFEEKTFKAIPEVVLDRVQAKFFPKKKLPVWHFNDVVNSLKVTTTSPGIYYKKLGCHTKQDAIDRYLPDLRYFQHKTKYTTHYNPIATARTELAIKSMLSDKPKTRIINVYPIEVLLTEMMFSQPMIGWFKRANTPYALSDKAHTLDKYHGYNMKLDLKSFDASTSKYLIKRAFDMIENSLDFTKYHLYGKPTSVSALIRAFRRIRNYFMDTPSVFGNTKLIIPGIPSGSSFTGIIGSICNALIIEYAMYDAAFSTSYSVYGDDAILAVNFQSLPSYYRQFGYECKLEPIRWLGYYRSLEDGIPVWNIDESKMFAALMRPHRKDRCLCDAYVRALAIRQLTMHKFHGSSFVREEIDAWLSTLTNPPNDRTCYDRDLVRMLNAVT